MNWLKWQKGRQAGGYDKLMLISNPFLFRFDCYILRFPPGSEIKPHRDPVKGRKHYRLNIIVWRAYAGGILGRLINERWQYQLMGQRCSFFRSDLTPHCMTQVTGTQYILSLGWAI